MNIVRTMIVILCVCGSLPGIERPAKPDTVTVSGRVTDFAGTPLAGADVMLLDSEFEPVAAVTTDQDGAYSLDVARGRYGHLFACKDYRERYLEYWAWNLTALDDMTVNARIDRLELYAMNAFVPQGTSPSWIVYFRPMSLTKATGFMERAKTGEDAEALKSTGVADIAPSLEPTEVTATVDGAGVKLLELSRVREAGGKDTMGLPLVAYLIHIDAPEGGLGSGSRRICITLDDTELEESGEACVFWTPELPCVSASSEQS